MELRDESVPAPARSASGLTPDGRRIRAAIDRLGLYFHNWLEAHVLRREAEALLSPHSTVDPMIAGSSPVAPPNSSPPGTEKSRSSAPDPWGGLALPV